MIRGIIIEGIDCGGKTSLIENIKFYLKDKGGYDVKQLEHKDCNSQFRRYLFEYALSDRVIFDRSHFSELVFGKYLRGASPFSVAELKILNLIVKLEFIVVLAEPDYNTFKDRIDKTKHIQVIGEKDYSSIISEFRKSLEQIDYLLYKSSFLEEKDTITHQIIDKLTETSN